jgi:MFS family permease|tara:strand:- start:2856 stop:4097 length:1242 start_codon:yes stop_codon:yes gene_type:complete
MMKSLHYYLLGTGSWFFAQGIQSVVFAWLVTIVLQESPKMVGLAQMALLIPATVFMLVGGSLADHYGGRRIAIIAQACAAFAPLYLISMVVLDNLDYQGVIIFAVFMGCAQAFVTPARDSLLNQVAGGKIQRRVLQVSMTQFGVQMLGFVAASFADRTGAAFILIVQVVSMCIGVYAFYRLDIPSPMLKPKTQGILKEVTTSIVEGYRTVRASPSMRAVVIQNCAMGIFFMGSYIVTLPLLVRDVYQGASFELSWMNAANALGLVTTIMVLLRFGDIYRQGRALLLAHVGGAIALASSGLGFGFGWVVVCVFAWGVCGGVAMTMARTIIQEQAPEGQRGRIMAFHSFSFIGSGPIGALFCGFLVEQVGPKSALMVASGLMLVVMLALTFFTGLWQLDAKKVNPRSMTSSVNND